MSPLILVVLLWISERGTRIIGHLILIYIHESATANAPLIINGAPSLPRGPSGWSHICHTPFLDTCSLTFLVIVICSVARFRLRAHTLRIETVTWTHNTSPTCHLCNAHDVQDEQHVLFHCTHPHVVSLRLMRPCFLP